LKRWLAGLAVLLVHASVAFAGLCGKATVAPSTGAAPLPVHFRASPVEGCERNRGKEFWLVDNNPEGNSLDWAKTFETPGEHTWDFCSWLAGCEQCCDGGTIRVSEPGCSLECSVTASKRVDSPPLVVDFTATATPRNCPSANLTYEWSFGDLGTSTQASVQHEYPGSGPYTWLLTARYGSVPCQRQGTVELDCLQIGQLRLCADEVESEPGSSLYKLSGNVNINQSLWFSGEVFYEARSEPAFGALITSGRLFVKLMSGESTLVQGNDLTYEVRGDERALHPVSGNPDFFSFDLGGLPLPIVGARPLVIGANHVKLATLAWLGIPGLLDLARLETEVTFPNGGEPELTRFEAVAGSVSKSISFAEITGTYDPRNNKLDMSTVCRFPFSGGASFAGKFGFERCGPNLVDLTLGGLFSDGIAITPPGVPLRFKAGKDLVIRTEHMCDRFPFLIYLGTRATLCVDVGLDCISIPGEFFRISDLGAGYQHPLNFDIRGGTPTVLGYPIASARGKIQGNQPPYGVLLRGNANLGGFIQGAVDVAVSFSRALVSGSMRGTLHVPNFSCGAANVPCKLVKNVLKRFAGALPASFADVTMTLLGRADTTTWSGTATGNLDVGPVRLVSLLQFAEEGATLQIGTNYASMYSFLESRAAGNGAGFERQALLTGPTNDVMFGFIGSSGAPAAYLVAPNGLRITADNVGQIQGAFHSQDDDDKSTVYFLPSIAPGTWTLGVEDAAAAGAVTLSVIGPQAPPLVQFEQVERQGESVQIRARVAPFAAATMTELVFFTASGGGVRGAIAGSFHPQSGVLSATWDISTLATDTYYLAAQVDDGMNPMSEVVWPLPMVIDRGTLAAPRALRGERVGNGVDLQWTAAPGSNVTGYNVLYSDDEGPGYRFNLSVFSGTRVTVTDLDLDTPYRFAVVAYDSDNAFSLPSNEITLRTGSSACSGDCNDDGLVAGSELIEGIALALRETPSSTCTHIDGNGDLVVTIDEIVLAVRHARGGCPAPESTVTPTLSSTVQTRTATMVMATATPTSPVTSTPTAAATPTATIGPSPTPTPSRTPVASRSVTPTATATPTPTGMVARYCANPGDPIDIPDDDAFGIGNLLSVDSSMLIDRLRVTIAIDHTWVGDLVLTLTRLDDLVSVTLLDRPGYPASTFGCSNDDIRCELLDESSLPVEEACGGTTAALDGLLRPTEPLAVFDNTAVAGTWQLEVSDRSPGDTGKLIQWCIETY